MIRESLIEAHLVNAVAHLGGEIRKCQWIGRRGAPDRCVMLPGGVLIWVECKAPGEKCEDHQLREHERMRRLGQRVEVVDSLARVKEVLR